jgi:hypothetical protein
MLKIRVVQGGVRFQVRVSPRSSRTCIWGQEGGVLKVKLTASPQKGEANKQCLKLLAKALGITRSNISIIEGEKSRSKWIEVKGLDESQLESRLAELLDDG